MIIIDVFTDFLSKVDHRKRTEEVLHWVSETFPQLKKELKWNQPMFTDHGTYIIGFSVAKRHLAVAPEHVTIHAFSDQIEKLGYHHTKELIRIKWNQAIPYKLLEEIIHFNIEDKVATTTFWRQ